MSADIEDAFASHGGQTAISATDIEPYPRA
jgi:hypothetical protein